MLSIYFKAEKIIVLGPGDLEISTLVSINIVRKPTLQTAKETTDHSYQ